MGELGQDPLSHSEDSSRIKMHKAENMLQAKGSLEERGGAPGLPGGAETPLSQADQSVQVRKGPGKGSQLSVSIKTTWRAFEKGTPRTN